MSIVYLLIYLFLLCFSGKPNYLFYLRIQIKKLEYLYKILSCLFSLLYNGSIRALKKIFSLLNRRSCWCMVPTYNNRTCFVTSFVTFDTDTTLVIMAITTVPSESTKDCTLNFNHRKVG